MFTGHRVRTKARDGGRGSHRGQQGRVRGADGEMAAQSWDGESTEQPEAGPERDVAYGVSGCV